MSFCASPEESNHVPDIFQGLWIYPLNWNHGNAKPYTMVNIDNRTIFGKQILRTEEVGPGRLDIYFSSEDSDEEKTAPGCFTCFSLESLHENVVIFQAAYHTLCDLGVSRTTINLRTIPNQRHKFITK